MHGVRYGALGPPVHAETIELEDFDLPPPETIPDEVREQYHFFYIAIIAVIGVLIHIAVTITFFQSQEHWQTLLLIIGSYYTVVSCLTTSSLIYHHLTSYTQPIIQRRIVRILLMIPIYSICSLVSFRFVDWAKFIDLIRDSYEAYVLWQFFEYLRDLFGGAKAIEEILSKEPPFEHPPPLCCLGPISPNARFLSNVRLLITQYVILRPMCTGLAFVLWAGFGKYNDGVWSFSDGYPYIVIIQNISVTLAFGALVYFYKAAAAPLRPFDPLWKFASVKAVIFLSFWQAVGISLAKQLNLIPHIGVIDPEMVVALVLEFLIVVEMTAISFLHHSTRVFSYKPFLGFGGQRNPFQLRNVIHGLAVDDVVRDLSDDTSRLVSEATKGVRQAARTTRRGVERGVVEARRGVEGAARTTIGGVQGVAQRARNATLGTRGSVAHMGGDPAGSYTSSQGDAGGAGVGASAGAEYYHRVGSDGTVPPNFADELGGPGTSAGLSGSPGGDV